MDFLNSADIDTIRNTFIIFLSSQPVIYDHLRVRELR